MKLHVRIGALIAISLFWISSAGATDIGTDTASFDLLSTDSKVILGRGSQTGLGGNGADMGMLGGTSAILNKGSQSVNEVVTSPKGITVKKGAEAFGCITGGAPIKVLGDGSCQGLIDNGGQRAELTTMANAIGEVGVFAGVANTQVPEQTLQPVVVPKNGNQTITNDNSFAGLHVISIPSVTLKKDAQLTIAGQTGDSDLLLVDGNFKWGADAFLSPNGVTLSKEVLVVVSGKLVSIGAGSQFTGTIVALNATCTVGAGAQVIGQLICGKKISLGAGSQVQYDPTIVTIP